MKYINARLSFGARQALISALLLAPILLLLSLFVGQCWKDIALAQREMVGSAYLEDIWSALTSGGGGPGPSSTDNGAKSGRARLSSELLRLKGDSQRWDLGGQLMSDVSDRYNLVLDPELDSYYAVIVLTPRLPFLHKAAEGVTAAADGQGRDRATRIALAVDRLRVEGLLTHGRLEDSMKFNRDGVTRRNLSASAAALDQAVDRVGDLGELLETGGDRAAFAASQAELRAQIGRTYTATATELRRLVRARIHRLEVTLGLSLAIVLASLAAACALAAAISRGLSQRILGLLTVIDRLAEDSHDAVIPNLDDSNETGRIARALAMFKESRAALRQTEQRLDFALEAGRLGSWELDLRTGRLVGSPHHLANFGLEADQSLESLQACLERVHPADRQRCRTDVRRAIDERTGLDIEFRTIRAGGGVGWIELRGRANYDAAGTPVRMAGVSLDISDRKADEARLKLMFDELNHRVKNTLATVQSIAMQTLRTTDQPPQFEQAFRGRISALAGTHELLTEASWEGASLVDIVSRALAPHTTGADGERVRIEGPSVMLGPTAAVTLHMALHELATNAAKFGALSSGNGRVEVSWRVVREGGSKAVEIDWRESGGPAVTQPLRRGFGSRLIEQGLARQLKADVRLDFSTEGVACHIRVALLNLSKLAA